MKKVLLTILIIVVLFILYGFFINTNGLTIKEYNIETANLSNSFSGFKIVHFSDLLYGSTQNIDDLKNITKRINEMNADIIIFTGDLIANSVSLTEEEKDNITEELKNIDCTLYKYAIIGDNDKANISLYEEIMSNSDFNILNDDYTYLFYKDINPIKIIGLSNLDNINKLLNNEENITPNYTIVLTHYPDNINSLPTNEIDLVLTGHSLGGQIKLPFVGSLIKRDGAKLYIDDYYEVNDTKLFVSSGLGTEKIKFRTFNKPSINVYRFQIKENI